MAIKLTLIGPLKMVVVHSCVNVYQRVINRVEQHMIKCEIEQLLHFQKRGKMGTPQGTFLHFSGW